MKDKELEKLGGKSTRSTADLSEVTLVTKAETEARAKSTERVRLRS
jgi:hypothetical protein